MLSCFTACKAAVCISSMIRMPKLLSIQLRHLHPEALVGGARWWGTGEVVVCVCVGGDLCWRHKTKEPFNTDKGCWGLFDSYFFPFCALCKVVVFFLLLTRCFIYHALHYFWLEWIGRVSHIFKWVKVSLHSSSYLIRRPLRWMERRVQIRCFYEVAGFLLQSHNCWIASYDDPVQLNRESLSRPYDGDSGVCVGL